MSNHEYLFLDVVVWYAKLGFIKIIDGAIRELRELRRKTNGKKTKQVNTNKSLRNLLVQSQIQDLFILLYIANISQLIA